PRPRISASFFVLRPVRIGAFMRLRLGPLATRPAVAGLFCAPAARLSSVLLPAAIRLGLIVGGLAASVLIWHDLSPILKMGAPASCLRQAANARTSHSLRRQRCRPVLWARPVRILRVCCTASWD